MNSLQIIADIMKKSLNLTTDQIWIYNQRRNIPTTSGLFVVVTRVAMKPYANNNVIAGDSLVSGQWMQETISINMFSKNFEALDRVHEVLGALASPLSQFVQQQTGILIASIPQSVTDTSAVEGAGMLYRTTITTQVLTAYSAASDTTFFDPDTIQYSLEETEA